MNVGIPLHTTLFGDPFATGVGTQSLRHHGLVGPQEMAGPWFIPGSEPVSRR